MSPNEAIHSSVVLFYLATSFGLLLVAGLVLALLYWFLHKNVDHACKSYRGWLFIVPLTAVAIFLGRETTIGFFTVVALLGFREFARGTGLSEDQYMTGAVYFGIQLAGVVALVSGAGQQGSGFFDLFMTLPVFVIAGILIIPILRNQVHGQLRMLGLAILGFIEFGWMWGHLSLLTNTTHAYVYLGYLLFAVEINDISAYVSGKMFGRHLLRSNISPKKTWEGCLGALAVSLTLPWLLWFTFPHLRPQDLVVLGLIVGIGGQLGDLVMSVIKRDLGIKDMGTTIPGHGGIVDRIDSLIYVAPLFFHYLRYCHNLDPA